MDKTSNAELVVKLTERLKIAKVEARIQTDKDKWPKLIVGGGEERVNEKYISNEKYFQISQLYWFLREHPNLSHEEFEQVLKSRFLKFKFLRKLNKVVENLDDELREHGIRYVAIRYAEKKYSKDFFNHWMYG